jgi:hypothetical protein
MAKALLVSRYSSRLKLLPQKLSINLTIIIIILLVTFTPVGMFRNRLCGLVVRVPSYRPRGSGFNCRR